jgi:hypothetical protein
MGSARTDDSAAADEGTPAGEPPRASATERVGNAPGRGASTRAVRRRLRLRGAKRHHAIAPLDCLTRRAEEGSRATGQSLDESSAVVVEDLERAAAALNTRTAPLVPGCGVLVAVSGVLVKAEPSSNPLAETFVSLAILCAVGGFAFLTRALFAYAGRRNVGLSPTADDIAFARDSLVRKHTNAHRGSLLAGVGLTCLIIGILLGVHIDINSG